LADDIDRVVLGRGFARFLTPAVSCRGRGKILSVLVLGSEDEDELRYGEFMTDISVAQTKGTRAETGCWSTFHRLHGHEMS
jgi:hypothetical protein